MAELDLSRSDGRVVAPVESYTAWRRNVGKSVDGPGGKWPVKTDSFGYIYVTDPGRRVTYPVVTADGERLKFVHDGSCDYPCKSCRYRDTARQDGMYCYPSPPMAPVAEPKRLVPTPDEHARILELREQSLILAALKSMDADVPVFATELPAGISYRWHADWARARRDYVQGIDGALDRMLDYVTMVNPPLHSDVLVEAAALPAPAKPAMPGHDGRQRLVSWDDFGITIRRPVFPSIPDTVLGWMLLVVVAASVAFAIAMAFPGIM